MATLIRKDAWKLSAISTWEPTLLWYAKAVGEMSTRPAMEPPDCAEAASERIAS